MELRGVKWLRCLTVCGLGAALALLPAVCLADPTLNERPPLSLVMFGSLDLGPPKSQAGLGFKFAIGGRGLDASGFRLGFATADSTEPLRRRPDQGRLYRTETSTMLGYEWRIDNSFLAVSLGQQVDAVYAVWGPFKAFEQRLGPRIQLDLWLAPSPDMVLQFHAFGIGGRGSRSGGRLSVGWRLRRRLFLGPEVEAFGERDYYKVRTGLQLSGIELFGTSWRISVGRQKTSEKKSATYATLGLHWHR